MLPEKDNYTCVKYCTKLEVYLIYIFLNLFPLLSSTSSFVGFCYSKNIISLHPLISPGRYVTSI